MRWLSEKEDWGAGSSRLLANRPAAQDTQLPGEEVNVEGRLPGQEERRGGKEGAGDSLVLEGLFDTADPCTSVLSLLQVGHTTVEFPSDFMTQLAEKEGEIGICVIIFWEAEI